MKENIVAIQNLGMSKDTSISSLKTDKGTGFDYAYTNHNIRLTAKEDNTLYAITNEKGTLSKGTISGKLLGHCKLSEYLTIFVKDTTDKIYRIDPDLTIHLLYSGSLGFDLNHPIEAVGYYESTEVQKVYWVDGKNQNRFINIVEDNAKASLWNDYSFDFQGHLKSTLDVTLTKTYDKAGYFLPGTLQYFITYYNKFGVETCILWNSDLQYTSLSTRGAKADEAVSCAFDFKINNIDSDYEYLRIYSVYRSGVNSTPEAKLVVALKIDSNHTMTYTDYGYDGQQFNAQDVPYIGGQDVRANTLDYKQDTLFLGDVTISSTVIPDDLKAELNKLITPIHLEIKNDKGETDVDAVNFQQCDAIGFNYKQVDNEDAQGAYEYKFQLGNSQKDVAGFKKGEIYRFSLQFQSMTGEWTPAHWIGDRYCNLSPTYRADYFENNITIVNGKINNTPITLRQLLVGGEYYYTTTLSGELYTNIPFYKVTGNLTGHVGTDTVIVREIISSGVHYFTTKLDGNINSDDTIYKGTLTSLIEETDSTVKATIVSNYIEADPTKYVSLITDLDEIESIIKTYEDTGSEIVDQYNNPIIKWETGNYISNAVFNVPFNTNILALLMQYGFINYRLLVAETSIANRRIVTLGIINPTMFNYVDRYRNRPFSIGSWSFRPRNTKMLNRHFDCMPTQNTNYGEIQGIMEKGIPGFEPSSTKSIFNAYYMVFAVNYLAGYRVGFGLVYYNTLNCKYYGETVPSGSASNIKTRRYFYNYCMTNKYRFSSDVQQNIDTYWNSVLSDNDQYSNGLFLDLEDRQAMLAITNDRSLANCTDGEDYVTAYGIKNAVVVSCGYKRGMTKIYKVQSYVLSTMNEDLNSYGRQIILSEAMLPSEGQWHSACWKKSSGANVWAWIGMAIAVAAAVVATVFSAGAASGALVGIGIALSGTIAPTIVSAVSSVCAVAAIAGGAGMAAYARQSEDMSGIDKELAAKGFICLTPKHSVSDRRQFASRIKSNLKLLFDSSTCSGPWGGIEAITDRIQQNSGLKHGHIGQDANAYALGGTFDTTSLEERELRLKLNLYFTDESIVTLNSPEMEEVSIQSLVNESEALQLNLVGTIPMSNVYGTYDMKTQSNGLANSASVLKGSDVTDSENVEGLLNGYLYQDCEWGQVELNQSSIKNNYILAGANVAKYKTFMWHRDVSWSLYTQEVQIRDVFGDPITEAPAQPHKKIFANLRYASSTNYHKYHKMQIDSPKIFSSDQTTICPFYYGGYQKYYYGNIDSIITTDKNYSLLTDVCNEEDLSNPDTYGFHRNSSTGEIDVTIKDPISLRYKETPHAVIPITWLDPVTSTILPYMESEESPASMYEMYSNYNPIIDILGIDEIKELLLAKVYGLTEGYRVDLSQFSITDIKEIFGTRITTTLPDGTVTHSVFADRTPVTNFSDSEWNTHPFKQFLKLFVYCQSETILTEILKLLNTATASKEYWERIICDDTDAKNFISYLKSNAPHIYHLINSSGNPDGSAENQSFYYNDSYKILYIRTSDTTISALNISKFDGSITTVLQLLNIKFLPITSNVFLSEKANQSATKIKRITPIDSFETVDDYTEYYPNIVGHEDFFIPIVDCIIPYWFDATDEPDASRINTAPYLANSWNQDSLDWGESSAYLFMGELVKKEFDYNTWNGGYTDYALQQLTWNVASGVTPVNSIIKKTWGDTYYQRWDCLKTYPFTEEDKNSVVDVLSCMVETHTNIDGRCDVNRGTGNLINNRPTNFNIINMGYTLSDNFFSYQVLDEKFDKTHFENEIVWSLTKHPLDDVDSWTNLLETNSMYLDGQYGALRKILNAGDNLYGFQDRAINHIEYNEKAALATDTGLPLQMGNTGKVTGYTKLSDKMGCHNKYSISSNSSGIYFIDDYNKTFNMLSRNEGLGSISTDTKFSVWFNKNVNGDIWNPINTGAFKSSYDELTHDLYLSNNLYCLVYNTLLLGFTSFMDYQNTPVINNLVDKSVLLHQNGNLIKLYEMFKGQYNNLLGLDVGYSMEYRVSPSPYTDNLFTNYEFVADWADPVTNSDDYNQLGSPNNSYNPKTVTYQDSNFITFDTVEAWNEYQHGEMAVPSKRVGLYKLKPKFRIWRGDIPRDGYSLTSTPFRGDRMRNPWIHLKFIKNPGDHSKMTFHNLTVIYYN